MNFIAVSQALTISSDAVAASLAADNLICAVYFMTIFYLSRNIAPENSESGHDTSDMKSSSDDIEGSGEEHISMYEAAQVVGLSSVICWISSFIASIVGKQGILIPVATLITVVMATLVPGRFTRLASAGEVVAALIMQVSYIYLLCNLFLRVPFLTNFLLP